MKPLSDKLVKHMAAEGSEFVFAAIREALGELKFSTLATFETVTLRVTSEQGEVVEFTEDLMAFPSETLLAQLVLIGK